MKRNLASFTLCVLVLALSALPTGSQAAGREGSISGLRWGSGWVPLSRNNPVTLQHNLGGDLYRLQDDVTVDQMRTRIWQRGSGVNMPVVIRGQ